MSALQDVVERPLVVDRPQPRFQRRAAGEHVAAAAVVLWWAGPMTTRLGGRGPGAQAVLLVLLAALILLSAPWRHLTRGAAALTCLVPLGALVMCLAAPTGWYGADDFAAYTGAALTVAATVGYARTSQRRLLVVTAICLAGVVEFGQALLPWLGGQDPSRPMIGTFYWWNPFAAFLLPALLLAAALAICNQQTTRMVGWCAAPFCFAGILFSSSRATLALAVIGYGALLLVVFASEMRKAALARWVALAVVCLGVAVALSGPPFFPVRGSINAAAQARAASGQSVTGNGLARVEFWQRAIAVVEHRPWVGSGSHALVDASEPYVPAAFARSNLVHNGYLQALSDGGLALGLPFLLAAGGCLFAGVRRLLSARLRCDERWLRAAMPIALAASATHSLVDFDWSHPSDFVLSALLSGVVLALPVDERARRVPGRLYVPVALSLVSVAVVASWHWDDTKLDVGRMRGTTVHKADRLRSIGSEPLRDYRWAAGVLNLAVGQIEPIRNDGVSEADLSWAVRETERVAPVNDDIALLRARALVVLDRKAEARAIVEQQLSRRKGLDEAGPVADRVAEVLAAAGSRDEARGLLLRFLTAELDAHAGEHLSALLDVDAPAYDEVDRCVYARVPAQLRDNRNPGRPADPESCAARLQGASR